MHPKHLQIKDFSYPLPDERIARYPLAARDASKLLVYKEGVMTDDVYSHIADHIPEGSLMVFNQTKVVHARLLFSKPGGGSIEIFCLEPGKQYKDIQTAMLEKGQVYWECLVGGAKKWKEGNELTINCTGRGFTLSAKRVEKHAGSFTICFRWTDHELTFAEVLLHAGKVPLPPYLNRAADAKDESSYQTIFAKDDGSVAAPTAGLHFTEAVMNSLQQKNISAGFVTLHVGAGTFMPVKSDTMQQHEMHAEWIELTRQTIAQLAQYPKEKIVAVGTTSLRTLESLYHIGNKLQQGVAIDWPGIAINQWDPYEGDVFCTPEEALLAIMAFLKQEGLEKITARTRILIAPGYTFRMSATLATNFHQPQSTLLLLVAALIGKDWQMVYDHALQNGYRFLSYGDGSLLFGK